MKELLTNLGIDWRLLIAQVVNFAILVFILKKFLWKPLLTAIAERQAKAASIEEMAKAATRAEVETRETREAAERIARQRASQIIQEAEAHAKIISAGIKEHAEKEAKDIVGRAEKEAEAARERIFAETRTDLADLALRAAEKVLKRSVREEDDMRLAKSALQELES